MSLTKASKLVHEVGGLVLTESNLKIVHVIVNLNDSSFHVG